MGGDIGLARMVEDIDFLVGLQSACRVAPAAEFHVTHNR